MAGEKVNTNNRVIKKPQIAETEPTITMTASQLQEFMAEAFKSAMGQVQSIPEGAKSQIEQGVNVALTTRINERNKKGQQFDAFLSNPTGPRRRLVIDRIYREYTGSAITSTINGNTVKVPVNGQPYMVHPAHYSAIKSKLAYISATRDRNVEGHDIFGDDVGDYQQISQR